MPKIIGSKKDHPLQQFLKTYIKKKIKCCHIINCRPYVLIFFHGNNGVNDGLAKLILGERWQAAAASCFSSPLAERSPGRSAAACRRMDAAADADCGKQRAGEVGEPRSGRAHALSIYGRTMNGVPASATKIGAKRSPGSENEHKGREQAGGRKELVGIGPLPQIGSRSSWRKSGSERRQDWECE